MKKLTCILTTVMLIFGLFAMTALAEASENQVVNLVTNGDFESGDTEWTLRQPNEGATFSIAQTGGIDGSKCAYVDKAQGAGDLILPISMSGLSAGDVLKFSAKVKLAGNCPNGKTTSTAKWLGNNALLDTTGATVSGEWVNVSYTTTLTDALLSSGKFALRVSHPGNTDNYDGGYYMDDVVVSKYDTDPDNLIFNHNFNYGTEGWNVRNASVQGAATMTAQSTGGVNNSACIKIDKTSYLGDVRQYVSVKEGETYYVSAKIKMDSAATASAGIIFYYDGGNVWITQNQSVGTDGYVTIGGEITIAAGQTSKAEISVRASNVELGGAYIDDVAVVTKSGVMIEGISIDGVAVSDFDKKTTEYVCGIPYGTTTVPTITAVVGDYTDGFKTTYVVKNATLEGATLTATSPNATQSKTYNLRFEEMERLTISDVLYSGTFAQGNTMTASVSITNNSLETLPGSDIDVTLIVGLYDENGALKDIGFATPEGTANFSIAPRETKPVTATINISNTNYKLSAHIIDSFTSHKPLSFMQDYNN